MMNRKGMQEMGPKKRKLCSLLGWLHTTLKSIDVVSKVAYQCLHKDQEKRPTMALVIQELEKAFNIHEEWEFEQQLPKDYEKIMKMIEHSKSQLITKKDLYSLLYSGICLNNGKVVEMIDLDGSWTRPKDEVHPVLPNQNETMHERPAGKIRHFRINISQLSMIGAAKVSHFEILCRIYGVIPIVGLFQCFYVNSKKNGWMSFSKRSDNAPLYLPCTFSVAYYQKVTRDHAPVEADFNAQDYATLVAHPSSFRKFPEEFLSLVGLSRHYTLDEETYPRFLHKDGEDMDIFALIHTPDPTKVKIVEWEQNEDELLLLQTTIGRTVPLLSVAPDRAESELEASVDKLFDEGGSGNQTTGSSAVVGKKPRRQRKRKTMVVGAGEASHPPKKLSEDHRTPSGPSIAGKSRSAVQRLLDGAVLNADFRGEAIPTLPFMTSSISATPEQAEVDSLIRSSVLVMIVVTTVTSTVSPALVVKEKPVKHSLFSTDSSSAGGADPNTGVFLDLSGSNFLVGGHDQLITEFNVEATRQMSLSAEVRMRAEYNVKERRREAKATEAIRLRAEASNFETVEKSLQDEVIALKERNTILEKERNALDVKATDLKASVIGKERELTGTLKLELSSSRLQEKVTMRPFALVVAIGMAIDKGCRRRSPAAGSLMQEVLALQRLFRLIFPLLENWKSSKDASIERDELSFTKRTFCDKSWTCMEGTSDVVPATADTTTALSTTIASASKIAPISVDEYEVVYTDNQTDSDGNTKSFPNVDDAELNIP
ncbi:hypothetical protein Tco_0874145 [Tanacetum coccineum]|uniref:Uncharacterized protein n=1 Tax=Tanacetum coccineum TaxID=301880 RepID=A0ABQ5BMH1_9ASTR